MAVAKRFLAFDENGNVIEQTDGMTIEVDAGTTARSIVNKSQLDAEAAAREAADTALGNTLLAALAAETANRQAADTTLTQALAAEEASRLAQDTVLAGLISAEEAARIAADSAEATARSAADTTLQGNIDAEAARALAAEGVLSAAITTEAAARGAADTALQTAIDAEVTRATAAEGAEATARANADVALQGEIDAEEIRAQAAEATLTTNLAAEVTRATGAETTLQAAITAEALRASSAEELLSNGLAAEITRATAAETQIASDLAAEVVARTSAVAAEESARVAADNVLTGALAAEVSRAETRENAIETALNAEITRATAEEIAVEERSKAYTDARVQGLKPKDSVDYAFMRFMPAWADADTASSFVPRFKTNQAFAGVPAYAEVVDSETASLRTWVHYSAVDGTHVLFGETYQDEDADGNPITVEQYVDPTIVNNPEGISISTAYETRFLGSTSWANNWLANGYNVYPLRLVLVDMLESNNIEKAVRVIARGNDHNTGMSSFDESDLDAGLSIRVAVVPNSTPYQSNFWFKENRDLPGDGFHQTGFQWLESSTLDSITDVGAKIMAMDEAYGDLIGNGIYQRLFDEDTGTATFPRAPDFADGMEVSGAFTVVELGIRGMQYVNDGYGSTYARLDHAMLTAPNSALIFGAEPNNAGGVASAIVGTSRLRVTLFQRFGAYEFGNGFERPDLITQPYKFAVKADKALGIRVSSSGVALAVDTSNTYVSRLPSVPSYEHLKFAGPNPNEQELTFNSPLVRGAQEKVDLLHGHSVVTKTFIINTFSTPGIASVEDINNYLSSFGRGQAVKIDPVTKLPVPANYDSPEIFGVVFGYEGAYSDGEPSAPVINGVPYTGIGYLHIAVSGVLEIGYTSEITPTNVSAEDLAADPSLNFQLNDIVYLGAGSGFGKLKFADIPSGKWAIPYLRKISMYEAVILDRPATLKA